MDQTVGIRSVTVNKRMAGDLTFGPDEQLSGTPPNLPPEEPLLFRLIIGAGLARDHRQAGRILLGTAIVAVLVALWLIGGVNGGRPIPPPLPPNGTNHTQAAGEET